MVLVEAIAITNVQPVRVGKKKRQAYMGVRPEVWVELSQQKKIPPPPNATTRNNTTRHRLEVFEESITPVAMCRKDSCWLAPLMEDKLPTFAL